MRQMPWSSSGGLSWRAFLTSVVAFVAGVTRGAGGATDCVAKSDAVIAGGGALAGAGLVADATPAGFADESGGNPGFAPPAGRAELIGGNGFAAPPTGLADEIGGRGLRGACSFFSSEPDVISFSSAMNLPLRKFR